MSARVICVASAKGGSGKTVFTAALGHFLSALGRPTLIVDTDATTNGLSLFHLNDVIARRDEARASSAGKAAGEELTPAGIFDLARGEGPLITVGLNKHLDFLPATYRFQNTEDVSPADFTISMESLLSVARDTYDFIVLDAQAGSDAIAHVSMRTNVSDGVVIVSEYDPLSAAGVERLKSLFPDDLSYDRTWVLINKMLPEFASGLGDFLQVARYLSPIPWDPDVVRAYAQRTLALDLEHGNSYTLAITQAVKGLMGPGMEKEIDEWINSRASAVREPITRQVRDLEFEAEGLLVERRNLQHQATRRAQIERYAVTLLGASAVATVWAVVPGFNLIKFLATVLIACVGLLLLALSQTSSERSSDLSAEIEDARLRRREEVVEDRLKTLQALVEADPDELIRSRSTIRS